jgi:hypothetical protein
MDHKLNAQVPWRSVVGVEQADPTMYSYSRQHLVVLKAQVDPLDLLDLLDLLGLVHLLDLQVHGNCL